MSFKPTSVPTKVLLISIRNNSTSFRLNNIKGWDNVNLSAADFGTQAYAVFRNATRTRMELMEFDPSTVADAAGITIVRRGLDFDGDLTTEVTANKLSWTKGDTYVDLGTDTPQLWQWLKDYTDTIAFAGAPDASTDTKGLVEEATQAEVDAAAATGATGARLFVNPSTLYKSAPSVIPIPPGFPTGTASVAPTDTTARVSYIYIPSAITVNKVSFRTLTNVSTSPIDISLYSSDGATRLFSVSSAGNHSVSAVVSVAVSSVFVTAGYYWLLVNADTSALMQVSGYAYGSDPFTTTAGLLGDVTSEPVLSGTLTITSGTPPATITIASITDASNSAAAVRFDN